LDEKPLIVEWQGRYYDVAKFAKRHPGGEKVLRKVAGEDIASYLSGSRRLLGVKHEHSPAALRILDKYAIDRHEQMSDALDLSTPILWKVGTLHDHYWTWIHQPSDGIIRLFESNLLESLTRTKWFMVPMVWMPVVLFFTAHALAHYYQLFGLLIGGLIWGILFAIGTLTWTLVEYTLHRNVFHWKPNPHSYNEITFHFLMHGLHHKTPMDGDRLVFPPTPALLIVGFFYMVYRSFLPWPVFCAFASGKLFGYICYDMIHFYLHHGSPKPTSNLHYRKVYHHNHHFKDFDAGFGISTNLWDYFFETIGTGPI